MYVERTNTFVCLWPLQATNQLTKNPFVIALFLGGALLF